MWNLNRVKAWQFYLDGRDFGNLCRLSTSAASLYFEIFDDFILGNKQDFEFKSRQRRPPIDKVNALLSFAYTILAHDLCRPLCIDFEEKGKWHHSVE